MNIVKRRGAFVSYSRKDKDFALEFAREMKSTGYLVWLDQLDIPTGARWDDEVEKALRECEIFLIILTTASVSSDNVKDEIGYAIDHGKRIMPVLLENCEIPLRLRRFQYVDFTRVEFHEGIKRAKQLLVALLNQQDPRELSIPPVLAPQKHRDQEAKPSPLLTNKKPIQRRWLGVGTGILAFAIFLGALGGMMWRELIFSPDPTSLPTMTEISIQTPDKPQPNASATQIPTVDIPNQDWNLFRDKVVQALGSINSYKSSGTGQDITPQGEISPYEADTENVIGRFREVKRYENGDVVELIVDQSDSCIRTNGSQWNCQSGQFGVGDFSASMVAIVEGKPSWDEPTVIDHGSRLEMYDGKECRLYFSEELYTGEGYQTKLRYELCFDLVTYFPVHQLTLYQYIVNDSVIETTKSEYRFYDINIPIEITLPRP